MARARPRPGALSVVAADWRLTGGEDVDPRGQLSDERTRETCVVTARQPARSGKQWRLVWVTTDTSLALPPIVKMNSQFGEGQMKAKGHGVTLANSDWL